MSNHIIWSNYNFNFEEWREDLEWWYPEKTEDELYHIALETNEEYLEDEIMNLSHISFNSPIIAIGDLGLWNGRASGYAMVKESTVSSCLKRINGDYLTWYVDDRGDLKCDSYHHDGVNHYLFRVFKDGVTEQQIENFTNKIYEGKATRADITRLTYRLGDDIASVYGWKIRGGKNGK